MLSPWLMLPQGICPKIYLLRLPQQLIWPALAMFPRGQCTVHQLLHLQLLQDKNSPVGGKLRKKEVVQMRLLLFQQ
jgi:hypothetical protein